MSDPIPSPVQEVLALFDTELASLKFGDLEPATLVGAADEVRLVAASVARAQAELDAARAVLAEKVEALLQKAHRALAYARVYAEDQPELASRIEAIALPRVARRTFKLESARPETATGQPPSSALDPPRRRRRASSITTDDTPLDLAVGDRR
jgi:hypothetical protein